MGRLPYSDVVLARCSVTNVRVAVNSEDADKGEFLWGLPPMEEVRLWMAVLRENMVVVVEGSEVRPARRRAFYTPVTDPNGECAITQTEHMKAAIRGPEQHIKHDAVLIDGCPREEGVDQLAKAERKHPTGLTDFSQGCDRPAVRVR